MVLVSWSWLEHHLSLLGADGEAEVVAGCGEAVHLHLHLMLITGVEGAVVGEEKVSENSLLHLRDGLQSPWVEQLSVSPELDVDAGLTVSEGISQHC